MDWFLTSTFFFMSVLLMHLFYFFVNTGQVNVLQKLVDINKLQTEYKAMLGLIEEAIISKSTKGIRFFNNNGRMFIQHCIDQIEESSR